MTAPVLTVRDLRTVFTTDSGTARAVDGVSFHVDPGESVGLVGESGCGKSVTALSLLRLIRPPGAIEPGSQIEFDGADLMTLDVESLRRLIVEKLTYATGRDPLVAGDLMQFRQRLLGPAQVRLQFQLPKVRSHPPVRCPGIVLVLRDLLALHAHQLAQDRGL